MASPGTPITGTPQGGILSPLLANVALSVLDEHFVEAGGGPRLSPKQRLPGARRVCPTTGLSGTRTTSSFWCPEPGRTPRRCFHEVATVLPPLGLRLSEEKTLITHIDEGLDFLGWRIQRHRKRGTGQQYVYNYPAKKALRSIKAKCKAICRTNVSQPLAVLLHRLNQVLRGWTAYFRPGVSARAFSYLRMIVWRQVFGWLRRKHLHTGWKQLRRRYCDGGWWPRDGEVRCSTPDR